MRFHPGWAFALAALAMLPPQAAIAQSRPADLVGTYNGSEPELGAELRLQADGRFEYHLSYGSLDETAQGTWTADTNGLVLTSDPVKEPYFELLGQRSGKGRSLAITLDAPGPLPKQLFSVFLLEPDGTAQEVNFSEGPLRIPMTADKRPRKIAVALSPFQVISSAYVIVPNTRAMHFRFVPNDIGKVDFDHHRLPREGDAFVLQRFDLTLRFIKETPEDAAKSESGAPN